MKNWRLISLLNIDYTIDPYVLATRIKPLMSKMIHIDQNGYIKNRFIGFNIRQIKDIIDYPDKFNIDSCIFYLDFAKVFDNIE